MNGLQQKIRVAVLCGGQSAEHEVSLESAKNVIQALDLERYSVTIILITRSGQWFLLDSPAVIINNPEMQPLATDQLGQPLVINLGDKYPLSLANNPLNKLAIDIIFPVLHGTRGEDGTLQGLLELLNIPYVGAGHLSSAICMDKEVCKYLLRAANIPIANWLVAKRDDAEQPVFKHVVEKLGLPLFVKPTNTGSSVGVSKVKNADEFIPALNLAYKYDYKVLIESYVPGRELECAVLGNDLTQASLPGEIIPTDEFYSYAAKYLDPAGAILKVPAELPEKIIHDIQILAKRTFAVLHCAGMARIDFFLTDDNQLIVNEANTLPGFTQISMYPKLWMVSGLSYPQLIDQLLQLAFARFQRSAIALEQPN